MKANQAQYAPETSSFKYEQVKEESLFTINIIKLNDALKCLPFSEQLSDTYGFKIINVKLKF